MSHFAFVSCQDICEGSQHAYRRMIAEDEPASAGRDLDFVRHLGDFVYEVVTITVIICSTSPRFESGYGLDAQHRAVVFVGQQVE